MSSDEPSQRDEEDLEYGDELDNLAKTDNQGKHLGEISFCSYKKAKRSKSVPTLKLIRLEN